MTDTQPAADGGDERWMRRALDLACRAEAVGEVPVGAVLVRDDELFAEGWNRAIATSDPTAHAEIVAIREAARRLGNYRLSGSTLFVTLEPCPMCAGAIVHARIDRLVFAASDPRTGAAGSVFDLVRSQHLNHRVRVTAGILEDRSAKLLREFFRLRRAARGTEL